MTTDCSSPPSVECYVSSSFLSKIIPFTFSFLIAAFLSCTSSSSGPLAPKLAGLALYDASDWDEEQVSFPRSATVDHILSYFITPSSYHIYVSFHEVYAPFPQIRFGCFSWYFVHASYLPVGKTEGSA